MEFAIYIIICEAGQYSSLNYEWYPVDWRMTKKDADHVASICQKEADDYEYRFDSRQVKFMTPKEEANFLKAEDEFLLNMYDKNYSSRGVQATYIVMKVGDR